MVLTNIQIVNRVKALLLPNVLLSQVHTSDEAIIETYNDVFRAHCEMMPYYYTEDIEMLEKSDELAPRFGFTLSYKRPDNALSVIAVRDGRNKQVRFRSHKGHIFTNAENASAVYRWASDDIGYNFIQACLVFTAIQLFDYFSKGPVKLHRLKYLYNKYYRDALSVGLQDGDELEDYEGNNLKAPYNYYPDNEIKGLTEDD